MKDRCRDDAMFTVALRDGKFRNACAGHVSSVLMDEVHGTRPTEVFIAGDVDGEAVRCDEEDE